MLVFNSINYTGGSMGANIMFLALSPPSELRTKQHDLVIFFTYFNPNTDKL